MIHLRQWFDLISGSARDRVRKENEAREQRMLKRLERTSGKNVAAHEKARKVLTLNGLDKDLAEIDRMIGGED